MGVSSSLLMFYSNYLYFLVVLNNCFEFCAIWISRKFCKNIFYHDQAPLSEGKRLEFNQERICKNTNSCRSHFWLRYALIPKSLVISAKVAFWLRWVMPNLYSRRFALNTIFCWNGWPLELKGTTSRKAKNPALIGNVALLEMPRKLRPNCEDQRQPEIRQRGMELSIGLEW